jgi:hypothetical protein
VKAVAPHTSEVQAILADVRRRGLTLKVERGKLRFRPKSAMTADLADRILACRPAVLAALSDKTPTTPKPKAPHGAQPGVSSVLSASEQSEALWSEVELATLARAGKTPADLTLVSEVKDVFAEFGASVAGIILEHRSRGHARRLAAQLIHEARRRDKGEAVALRDAWTERLAICTIDGGLSDGTAEQVALEELQYILSQQTST